MWQWRHGEFSPPVGPLKVCDFFVHHLGEKKPMELFRIATVGCGV